MDDNQRADRVLEALLQISKSIETSVEAMAAMRIASEVHFHGAGRAALSTASHLALQDQLRAAFRPSNAFKATDTTPAAVEVGKSDENEPERLCGECEHWRLEPVKPNWCYKHVLNRHFDAPACSDFVAKSVCPDFEPKSKTKELRESLAWLIAFQKDRGRREADQADMLDRLLEHIGDSEIRDMVGKIMGLDEPLGAGASV